MPQIDSVGALRSSISARSTVTVAEVNIYVDGSIGSDSNTGLSPDQPKLTRQAAFDLVPDIVKHNVAVRCSGVFSDSEAAYLLRHTETGTNLVVTGENDTTVVADNGGSPWVADISSVSTIGLTTAGWTLKEHEGWWVEIVDGPAAGQTRTIVRSTADTLTVNRDFSIDPGNAKFHIVRPTTEMSDGQIRIGTTGAGSVIVQRLYMTGSAYLYGQSAPNKLYWSHIISNRTAGVSTYSGQLFDSIIRHFWIDPDADFALQFSNTGSQCGCSEVGTLRAVNLLNVHQSFLFGSYFKSEVRLARSSMGGTSIRQGTNCDGGVKMYGVKTSNYSPTIWDDAGYATTRIGGGLYMLSSELIVEGGVEFSDSSTHGIEAADSFLHLDGVVVGSGNSGAGVYAHSKTVVYIDDGAPPTLTGSVGDITFDGTNNGGTWQNVDDGIILVSSGEMTMIKEVS